MGAFCVFGISKSQCLAKASKQIDSIEISKAGTRARSITEWAALRNARAAELFETLAKAEKVSPEFDAPQFCRDWLSTNPSEVRLAKIMVRGGESRRCRRAGVTQRGAGLRLDRVCRRRAAL